MLEFLGHGEELVPELRADDAALLLGVGHAVEQRGVALLGVHVHEVDIKLLGEDLLHLLGFALAQQTVVDEYASHLASHGAGSEGRHHGGIHAAGERQDHASSPTAARNSSVMVSTRLSMVHAASRPQMSNRKFLSSCWPYSVCLTSGWNCVV